MSSVKKTILDTRVINCIRGICIDGVYVSSTELGKRLGISDPKAMTLKREYEDKFGQLPTKNDVTRGIRPDSRHLQLVTEEKDFPERLLEKIRKGVEDVSLSYGALLSLSDRYLKAKETQQERAPKKLKRLSNDESLWLAEHMF